MLFYMKLLLAISMRTEKRPRGVVANIVDCDIVSEFGVQLWHSLSD